jgi:hypothetical protein
MKVAKGSKTGAAGRPRRTKAPAKRIADLLWVIENKLRENGFRPTVADFIRLLQLHKEFEAQRPRNIEVTWVDTPVETHIDAA